MVRALAVGIAAAGMELGYVGIFVDGAAKLSGVDDLPCNGTMAHVGMGVSVGMDAGGNAGVLPVGGRWRLAVVAAERCAA